MTQVILIALDGATLELLAPWFRQGHLSLLARLFREGAGGILQSTVPWTTPTAFASLATGTNPGKHGVYDFGRLLGRKYSSFVPTNGADMRGPTVWKLLSDAGLTCGLVNMPMTYPVEEIEHFAIAGIPYPSGSQRICHPPGLLSQLRERGWDLALNASDDLGGSYTDYYEGLHRLVRARAEASIWRQTRYSTASGSSWKASPATLRTDRIHGQSEICLHTWRMPSAKSFARRGTTRSCV